MGVSHQLARAAAYAPHLLLVETPGGWRVRVAVEQEVVRRGWRQALSPADADVLVICGNPHSPGLAAAIERVWDQMPGPRARAEVARTPGVASVLDEAQTSLLDHASQRADATNRGHSLGGDAGHDDAADDAPADHTDHDEQAHGGMDHGGMDHGGMHHEHMDMTGPGGIALASGGPDRDGLEMDVLHLQLGPVLAHWPAGLVVTVSLQGDVITQADIQQTPDDDATIGAWDGRDRAARRCDAAATLLALAGAARPAASARAARDLLLDPGASLEATAGAVDAARQRVARSWLLRWSLRGLAPVSGRGVLDGDVHDRLLRLLDLAAEEAHETGTADASGLDFAAVLPDLLMGVELATARLAVASVAGFGDLTTARRSRKAAHG